MNNMNRVFNVAIGIALIGFLILGISWILNWIDWSSDKPTKKYPIEVQYEWTRGTTIISGSLQCDSIRGDTLWKDGNRIVNKNIKNVAFK